MDQIIGARSIAVVVSSSNAPIRRNDGICRTLVPEIKVAFDRSRSPTFDEAAIFQRIVRLLKKKRYLEASRVYRYYYDPILGKDFLQNSPSTNFFISGRTRLGLISLYQENFCNGGSIFLPDFYEANSIQPFGDALEEAIRGNYAAAYADDELAFSRDPQFLYGDIVTGMLCETRRDYLCASKHWVRAAETAGPALPETTVYPDRFVAVQLLLHFRP